MIITFNFARAKLVNSETVDSFAHRTTACFSFGKIILNGKRSYVIIILILVQFHLNMI